MKSEKFKNKYKQQLNIYLLKESNISNEIQNLRDNITNLLKDSYKDYVIDKNEFNLCKDNRIYIPLSGVRVKLVDLGLSESKNANYVPNEVLDENILNINVGKNVYNTLIPIIFVFEYSDDEIPFPAFIEIEKTGLKKQERITEYRDFSSYVDKLPKDVLDKIKTAFIDYSRLIYKEYNFEKINTIAGKSISDIETLDELKYISEDWYNLVVNFIEEDKNSNEFPNNYNIEKTLNILKSILKN